MNVVFDMMNFYFEQVHMIIDCPSMAVYRDMCGIKDFLQESRRLNPRISSIKLFSLFVNDRNPSALVQRATDLYTMKLGWNRLMRIEI